MPVSSSYCRAAYRRRFSAAVVLSTLLLAPLLGWIGGVGYWACGADLQTGRPITSLLPHVRLMHVHFLTCNELT